MALRSFTAPRGTENRYEPEREGESFWDIFWGRSGMEVDKSGGIVSRDLLGVVRVLVAYRHVRC